MKTSRKSPIDYSEELAIEICDALANSHFGVRYLCRHKDNWPSEASVYRWLNAYPSFRERYTRARQDQSDALVSDIMEIASNEERDLVQNVDGTWHSNSSAIQRDRLKIDSIKWIACKLVPKVYGERKESTPNDNDAISQFRVENE